MTGEPAIVIQGDSNEVLCNLISIMSAQLMLRKGCRCYFEFFRDVEKVSVEVSQVPVVSEFSDIFLEELLGLPPEREIEFSIDVAPDTQPISTPPYQMAPAELKELKEQLQDLLDKGFIRPSTSPWGPLVIFMKKR